jgi:uncharacterized protein (TIGR00375 family)
MQFIADFHVHSKYSRATAKNLDIENLYIAAQLKGITVVGTGDFTHPQWLDEISRKLVPAEEGLFKLKNDIAALCDQQVPLRCKGTVRFLLTGEISNIYKKNGVTRKNHNLVFFPDLVTARSFAAKLDALGNIRSDGRPILGLDAKHLLEMTLEVNSQAFLVPAHIWTPWFSLLGSKSGFDSLEECFEDLSGEIFAAETGLSSDPAMNWRVSALDGLTLISNSDAHSPAKLGREANLFDTKLSYAAIRAALKNGDPGQFKGTLEFFPEEGKYHLDGHRKCRIRCWPKETMAHQGKCPVCGKPLTRGVLHRVEALADRPDDYRPEQAAPFHSLLPLTDILSDILRVGPASKRVQQAYRNLLEKLGPEFAILHFLPEDLMAKGGIPLLPEAIKRMRLKQIQVLPGYDGEFGKIAIFQPGERQKLLGQPSLFPQSTPKHHLKQDDLKNNPPPPKVSKNHASAKPQPVKAPKREAACNREQQQAVTSNSRALLISAGPGTGKTYTLTRRIALLISEKKVSPANILAVTFTNKAAAEMRQRLAQLLDGDTRLPVVGTFHAVCFQILKEHVSQIDKMGHLSVIDEEEQIGLVQDAIALSTQKRAPIVTKAPLLAKAIQTCKQHLLEPADELRAAAGKVAVRELRLIYATYQQLLALQQAMDFEDLVFETNRLLAADNSLRQRYQRRFLYIFIDEYQDLNYGQYRLVQLLSPPDHPDRHICVIGDPDQSIYGFRGSDPAYFRQFARDYPDTQQVALKRNYRSTEKILAASFQVICKQQHRSTCQRVYSVIKGPQTIRIIAAASAKAEAETVHQTIEQLVGGTGFFSFDSGRLPSSHPEAEIGFNDIGILYRIGAQGRFLADYLENRGIPCQIASRDILYAHKKLGALIALLRVVQNRSGFGALSKIGAITDFKMEPSTIAALKQRGYLHQQNLAATLRDVRCAAVPHLRPKNQQQIQALMEFLNRFQAKRTGQRISDKLLYLAQQTQLKQQLAKDPVLKSSFNRLYLQAEKAGTDVDEFLKLTALQTDTDIYDSKAQKVVLMTMHAAKGLEFNVVFIVGCEDGLIPYHRNSDANQDVDVDEERRLFYVAMTRAQKALYLTLASKRRLFGKLKKQTLSPFVKDIENELLHKTDPKRPSPPRKKQIQLELF